MTKQKFGLTGTALKTIALVLMVMDHIHYFFEFTGVVPEWFSMLARLSAPLFLFCTVEGFAHTHDRKRYFLRIWAIGAAMGTVEFFMIYAGAFRRGDGFYPLNAIFQDLMLLCIIWQGIDWLRQRRFVRGALAAAMPILWPFCIAALLMLFPKIQDAPIGSTVLAWLITAPFPMWSGITDGSWSFLAGGIALAAVIVFALWNVIMGSFRKEPVQTEFTVPNLLGMTIEEAEADERVKGIFTITEMGSRASSEYAEGQIVEQTPAADNVVRSNREIQVFVSTGEKTEPMTNVTGLEWRSAKIILDDLGLDLQYNWKDEYSDSITSGCVIRTEPAKGEMLRQGDVLLLYRSKGPEPRPVTVVSYLGYEQTTAVEEAETLGLKVTVKHVYSDALAGTVVEQSIAQDTVVTTGAEIVLTVSDGPDPSVSGTEGIPPEAA